jgi:signal transduction histidine kinase/sensor domain CHASE-containing protein
MQTPHDERASKSRRPLWLSLLIGAGGLTATLFLWQSFVASEEVKTEQIVRNETINVHNQIATQLNAIMFEFLRSATRWERFDLASAEKMQSETELLIQWLRGIHAVGWIDPSRRLRWIIPKSEYEPLLAVDLAADPRHQGAMATARQEGMAMTAAGDARPGSDQYFIYAAVSGKERPRGFLIGIFSAREMLDNLIEDEAFIGYSIALYDGGREIYRRPGSDSVYFKSAQNSLLSVGRVTWEVRVWPKAATLAALKSNADLIALATGLLATLLIAAVTYFAQTARLRAGQIAASNQQLQSEIAERRRAQEEIQLQLNRISTLREINSAATSTLDLRSVLNLLVDTIQRLLPYSALLVWLKDYETGELKRTACRNVDEKECMWKDLPGIPQLVQSAMEEKRAIIAEDIRNDPRTLDGDFYRRNGLISYLGVPLVAQDESVGVLVFLTRAKHEFNDDEVTFLSSVANQAVAAIHNSQLYEKIQNQAQELDKVNKLQADFTAMIAHDLRSPLANIMGIAEMMHDGLFGDTTEDQKSWLDRMRGNAKNLVQLVSDFLDVSKLESGSIELHHSSIDVLELVRNIVVNYLPVAAGKNITLTYRGDDGLAPIDADPRRLDQVITNLLSNALKFTGAGGTVEIRVRHELPAAVRIEVEDSGVGIPRSEISRLFQKYRQAGSARVSSQDGTGLGLVICKMIIEAHRGKIWVESVEGKGTQFNFTLPVASEPTERANGETRILESEVSSS